jgi:predicted RecA/RadA family phage recombinase
MAVMKNFIQPGNTVTFTADTAGVSSGDGVLFGSLFGVACTDADGGEEYEAQVVGVFSLAKDSSSIDAGAKVYWSGRNCSGSGSDLIGCAVEAAATDDTTVKVRLNGISVV